MSESAVLELQQLVLEAHERIGKLEREVKILTEKYNKHNHAFHYCGPASEFVVKKAENSSQEKPKC